MSVCSGSLRLQAAEEMKPWRRGGSRVRLSWLNDSYINEFFKPTQGTSVELFPFGRFYISVLAHHLCVCVSTVVFGLYAAHSAHNSASKTLINRAKCCKSHTVVIKISL